MGTLKYSITSQEQIAPMLKNASELILKGLAAGKVILSLGRESRSDRQNRLFHKLIGDISKTVKLDMQYDVESWKALLVDEFEQELARTGEKLSKPSKVVISFDHQRAVTIRPSTTDFKKDHANKFIEFLFMWGTEHGVVFKQDLTWYEDELRRA